MRKILGDYRNSLNELGKLSINELCRYKGIGQAKAVTILAAAEFYDFDAKYNNAESKTVVDPDLAPETVEKIRNFAVRIFKAVDGFGLARVDFFVAKKKNGKDRVIFNEINTLPGFTAISMYPMLWKARGIETKELVNQLIEMAYERF